MAITDKDRKKMSTVREVAGTAYAVKQLYDLAAPIVKKGIKKAKETRARRKKEGKWYVGKNIKKAITKRKTKKQVIKNHNNTYEEGK
tara:strand:+ start:659 stop:919 length:261 start_codon:yes stop_codon:yes gene_type:complete